MKLLSGALFASLEIHKLAGNLFILGPLCNVFIHNR